MEITRHDYSDYRGRKYSAEVHSDKLTPPLPERTGRRTDPAGDGGVFLIMQLPRHYAKINQLSMHRARPALSVGDRCGGITKNDPKEAHHA